MTTTVLKGLNAFTLSAMTMLCVLLQIKVINDIRLMNRQLNVVKELSEHLSKLECVSGREK